MKIKFNSFIPKTVSPMVFTISHGDIVLHSTLVLSGPVIVLDLSKGPRSIGICYGKHPSIDTEEIECALVEVLGSIDAKELDKITGSIIGKVEKYYEKQISRMGLAFFNRNARFSDLKCQAGPMLEKLYTGESIDKYWKLVAKPEHFVFGDDAIQVNPVSVLTLKKAPAVEAPAVEAPAVEAPAVEAPAVEAPAVEAPAVEAPDVEAPAVEAPDVEAPDVEAPDVEAPDVEAPDVEAPDVEAPAEIFDEIIPTALSKVEDIKIYLRSKGIEFPNRANKTELLSLI